MLTLTIAFLAALGVLSLGLGRIVLSELDNIGTKATDRLTWNLALVQISHLQVREMAYRAQGGENLHVFRLEFGIYSSRVAALRDSPKFEKLRTNQLVGEKLIRIQRQLDFFTPLVDGPDKDLVQSLPAFIDGLQRNNRDVRDLVRIGLQLEAQSSADHKHQVTLTLKSLGWVLVALVMALAFTALLIQRLFFRTYELLSAHRATAERLRVMVSSSLDAIVMVDVRGEILSFNGAAEDIFGFTKEEVVGKRLKDTLIPIHHHKFTVDNTVSFLKSGEGNLINKGPVLKEAKRKSGEVFPIELNVSSSQDGDNIVFVCFMRDVTDRIKGEEELRRARDDALAGERVKEKLLTVLSHEIRTPLNGILGSIELLENAEMLSQEQKYLRTMRASGELLLHHVNEVLEMSRLETGTEFENYEPFDLDELLQEIVDCHFFPAKARGNKIRLRCRLPGETHCVGNPERIHQVLMRLLANALKFTENGEIMIDVEHQAGKDEVEFRVCDTGEGIADEDLERIFEDFVTLDTSYSRKREGTGLGLAITRRVVEQMGGELNVESELGEGSIFWFTLSLPLVTQPQTTKAIASADVPRPIHILIVEDNDINRMLLEKLLQRQGHRVTCAVGGAEGVEAVEKERFDLVIMDISMPGMDGIEALRQIRTRRLAEGVEIVALTAHAAGDDQKRILEAGFTEILIKPATQAELARVIAAYTGQNKTINIPQENSDIQQFIEALGDEKARGYLGNFCTEVIQLKQDLSSHGQVSKEHQSEAHRLAGSAAVLGLATLRTCMQDIESAELESDPPLIALAEAWTEASEILAPHLDSSQQ
ncbi:hybrid sensor histidine kinase/response regulator [Sedimentitalea sp. CY04]|uniref:histidine kinase n=1 Tax=Parasedimentitalea denitrificans TaxID=2211118 RepID=A0ABX0W544_9RHOB|nr:hybrid sensor histidine kinase/response regulator [Sedimentitalea sp. CY04]